ncbi:MAG TPA: glycosyltransferase [Myxococcota bacterium]
MQSDSPTQADLSESPAEVDPTKSNSAKGGAEVVRLAVCLNTYLRPEGLERFLRALANATFANPAPRVDVVVVDNDAEGSARRVCEHARDWFPYDLHYVIEKRRGIPQARNTALSVAIPLADFVVITDDDVEPTPGWLAELLRIQRLYRADVVSGPNPPRFTDQPPAWVVEGRFFDSPRRATGIPIDKAATNNVLVRCAALERMDRLFDESLGLQGCDDTEFFRRMARDGYRMVWADDAIVYECIPAIRMTLRWVLQRAYRLANGRGNPELRRLEGLTRSWVLVNGLKCVARGAVHFAIAIALRQGPVARVHALVKLASGAGWLTGLFRVRYREYARTHGN